MELKEDWAMEKTSPPRVALKQYLKVKFAKTLI